MGLLCFHRVRRCPTVPRRSAEPITDDSIKMMLEYELSPECITVLELLTVLRKTKMPTEAESSSTSILENSETDESTRDKT